MNMDIDENKKLELQKERLNEAVRYLKYKGIVKTQDNIASKMGAARGNVSSALSGKKGVLTDQFIQRFYKAFPQFSYQWLLFGTGDMLESTGKTAKDRIREVLKMESVSLQTLGERSGEDFESLQYYLDKDKEPTDEAIQRFCNALHVNKEWIKSGNGDIYRTKTIAEKTLDNEIKPRLPMNVYGHGICEYLNGTMRNMCDGRPLIKQFPEYDFTLVLNDDSMAPKYWKGDEIALRKVDILDFNYIEWGHEYVIDTMKLGPRFKIIYEKESSLVLRSCDMERYPDFLVPKSEVYAIYRVVGMIRM